MGQSAVAGILDANGALCRVVVTEHWRMHHHVGKHEQLVILPNVLVQEPVPNDQAMDLVTLVTRYVELLRVPQP